ncbi:MAG TPA: xanthine dehydrogenase family protein molybdopterin-binding subunit [Solirubrobacteraceae bacterium]|nr:xanthine dehydrogenase family protein molybdopterin-binding subunit [Solirubrobacteraceae bacterium]
MEADGRWIGRAMRRVEDPRHLTGTASFVDDIRRHGVLALAFTRSAQAAARVAGLETEAARGTDGVRAVLTASDLGDVVPLVPRLDRPDFVAVELPLLARDRVRHVGEPLAMVVADTPHAAEDGAERVVVDYEPGPAVSSIEAAIADDAPRVHDEGNVLLDTAFHDDPALDGLLEEAALVLEESFASARLSAVPLEGRACLAEWDDRDQRLTLWTSTQVPHLVRTTVAALLRLPEHRLRVIAPDVGGGFGQKCVVAREEALSCIAARRLGVPVKWVEDRQESLVAGFQGHEQRFHVRAGFDGEGRLLGVAADILCDVGAYSTHPFTCGVEPLMAATELLGPYAVRHYRARARAVATNKSPMAPYRGVSRPQMVLAMERLLQKAALRLDVDPVEIRRRNLIPPEAFPWTGPAGLVIDRGSYHEALDTCAEALDIAAFRERQGAAREEGRLLGLGLVCFAERSGYGTEAFNQRKMTVTPGYDTALARMDPSGGVTVYVGTSGHGQGHLTTLAQVAADQLGVDPAQVEVRQSDTDATPYGWGTFASRSMVVGGGATKRATLALAERIRRLAGHLLEAAPEDIELRDGRAAVRGSPDRGLSFADVGRVAYLEAQRLPPDEDPGLECQASFDPPGTFSNATHGCIVEIDPETGAVAIERYVVAEDCGVMINPAIVEGQVRGGVAQGIAAALYEELVYTEEGQLQTASLMDYLVPTAVEIPAVEIIHLETPSGFSETGAKGMGEGGMMGAPACVATAVADAVAHLGIEIDRLPIRPDHVLAALHDGGRTEGSAAP